MKSTITYLLLSLLLLQHSGRLAVLVWFNVCQPEIARTLCENRARPQLHCDGHCVLAKKIKAFDEQEKKQAALIAPFFQAVCYVIPDSFLYAFTPSEVLIHSNPVFAYSLRAYLAHLTGSFEPPQC
jgi:hypothetical protein